MLTIGQISHEFASILKVRRRVVHQNACALRDADLIKSAGRGNSAARMTPEDAAYILLGLLVQDKLKILAEKVEFYANFECAHTRVIKQIDGYELPDTKFILVEFLAALFFEAWSSNEKPFVKITIYSAAFKAIIEIGENSYEFFPTDGQVGDDIIDKLADQRTEIELIRSVGGLIFNKIGPMLFK